MARGRMLSASIGDSKKLADVGRDAALLYVLALPYADRDGRLEVDRYSLTRYVGRLGVVTDWSPADLEEARDRLGAADLWNLYGTDLAEVVDFHEHQNLGSPESPSSLYNREKPSTVPSPANSRVGRESLASSSRPTREQVAKNAPKLREGKGREGKGSARARATPPPPASDCGQPVDNSLRAPVSDDLGGGRGTTQPEGRSRDVGAVAAAEARAPADFDPMIEQPRLRAACRLARDLAPEVIPMGVPSLRELREAASTERSVAFPDTEALAGEIVRVARVKQKRLGNVAKWPWILEDLGEPEPVERPCGTPELDNVAERMRAEAEEILRERGER